ncbi:E3 ubiquitin-protein ligase MARCH2-like isoform X2 [Pseudomyrmex gracilis]|uniref:E3 ubiquitin-protein ligase MARCH2-like isoform X2 n=1 Tax=Pseudomyrmex gracilis TaxID=219809 RepID=UPI00099546C7|nr:E3 ubiquitin-protein ligase MARCH2-like isoform X2 [Pseudomyrmex gracilis]
MSYVENAESQNDVRRASDVANEDANTVVNTRLKTSTDEQAQPSILDDAISKFNPEADKDKECSDTKLQDKNDEDDKNDTSVGSSDICRICHMSENALIAENNSSCDLQSRASSNLVHLGPLISACKCRGTVGLVHTECLERWLTESGRVRCELCGFRYATKRVRRYNLFRSVLIWIQAVMASRQMLLDVGYLAMTTPVAAFSCYVCALALKIMLQNGFYEIPWMIVAILPTCLLTLIAYWRWIITLGRLHGNRWRRYWRNNFVIRLIPDNEDNTVELRRWSDRFNTQDDFEQWRIEEIEEFV